MKTKAWLLPLSSAQPRKRQSALGRDLLRLVCQKEGIALSEEELELPGLQLIELLSRRDNIGLSITHCSKMVGIAMAAGRVGIDCEVTGRRRNWVGIARQFFTPAESEVISAARPAEREAVFLRHWVLKEAHIKAIQGSIFGDLNRLVIKENNPVVVDSGFPGPWFCREIKKLDCVIAICSSAGEDISVSMILEP